MGRTPNPLVSAQQIFTARLGDRGSPLQGRTILHNHLRIMRNTPTNERPKEKAARLKAYRKVYWQSFKQRHARIYGTLTNDEHAEIKRVAEANGRSAWEQIWRESLAYRQGRYLPTRDIQARIERLYGQLRSIGNNLNQIARAANVTGEVKSSRDVLRQLESLEAVIAQFVEKPWKKK